MDNKKDSTRAQFEQEAAALKKIIQELIDTNQAPTAAQLLEQYALLNPDDPDLTQIRNTLYPDGNPTGIDTQNEEIPTKYKLLNEIETIFILAGITTKRIGYTDSVLRKIKLMEEKWNYKPLLLTCIHNIDQRKTLKWLETAGDGQNALNPDTRVLNVYEYFQKSYADGLKNKAVFIDTDKETQPEEGIEVKKIYDGYMASLRTEQHIKNGKPHKDLVYDDWGYLNYIREYNPEKKDVFDVKYYTTEGKLCIKALFRPTENGIEHERILVYDDNEKITAQCANSAELAAVCLNKIIKEEQNRKFYLLVYEDGLMSRAARQVENKNNNVAKSIVVHSIFTTDAYDPKSKPQKFYKYLCENPEEFDGIIMLTNNAAEDFKNRYGNKDSLFVVPHPYPFAIDKSSFEKRDNLKAVTIARLDPVKLLDFAIEIFALVVKEIPKANFEIYGRGNEEERLKKLISKLGVEKNVKLMGYTDSPLTVFNNGILSIMTSVAEGFGLTLIESISNGCPAFAFDIKYGPSEIIDDGKTGYLIPRFNKEKYAEQIIKYLKDKNKQKTMSENCYKAAHKFSTEKFLENWYKMTKTLYERKIEHR